MRKNSKNHQPLLDLDDVRPILKEITVFGGLSEEQLRAVLKLLRCVSYKANETVFRQGEEPSHIYIIRQGEVKIIVSRFDEPLEIASFKTGQCFGETSVIGIQSHSASAYAVTDTELIVLERNALFSLFESDKELFGLLVLNIARETCRRLHRTDQILLNYVFRDRKSVPP